jgi:hypothetical protein
LFAYSCLPLLQFIGGHSDLLLGLALCSDAAVGARLREARSVAGAMPGALEAFLALRGVRTLPLRYAQQSRTAAQLARQLKSHPAVSRVRYPGSGGMIAFELLGGAAAADAACAATRLVVRATSLGGVESSMERRHKYPAEAHVPPGLIRFSAGLESAEDLWRDLAQALDAAHRTANRVFIAREKSATNLVAREAVAEADSGVEVAFETNDDNFAKLSRGERIDLETVNVVTGPLRLRDCHVGDALKVEVREKNERCLVSDCRAGAGSVDSAVLERVVARGQGVRLSGSQARGHCWHRQCARAADSGGPRAAFRAPLCSSSPHDWRHCHGVQRPVCREHL